MQDEISAAIAAHGMWKSRLKAAIETGKSDFSPPEVQTDDHCDFGKWLQGAAATQLKNSPHYANCVRLHREFHKVAAKVLSLALAGKKDDALHSMGLQGEFSLSSAALTKEMMDWKNKG